jgi:hypothetical protein
MEKTDGGTSKSRLGDFPESLFMSHTKAKKIRIRMTTAANSSHVKVT